MRCSGCGITFEVEPARRGRPQQYCSDACRARAYRSRKGGRSRALPGIGKAVVVQADARMLPLPDASVDLVVTSPPYYALRSYRDGEAPAAGQLGAEASPEEYLAGLWNATAEWCRVLKPTGSLWVLLGDKYAGDHAGGIHNGVIGKASHHNRRRSAQRMTPRVRPATHVPDKSLIGAPWRYALGCVDQLGLRLRAEVIWHKANPVPESVRDRARRVHETWFHFTIAERYYAQLDKPLPSVWRESTRPLRLPEHLADLHHDAAFPEAFPRRLVESFCPPGGTVLDPMGGTGTTAAAAAALGRVGISADVSHGYGRVATWRTESLGPTIRRRALAG